MPYALDENCRNPGPIHTFAAGHATGAPETYALREDGREPELIDAEPGAETIEALRVTLHGLIADEKVRPWEIAVLTGGSLSDSAVWKQRHFGNEALWNGHVGDDGWPNGLAAADVTAQPSDAVLCDSIRRFKGLERPVVVLVELDKADDKRREQLLYVGASRATQHLIVIGPSTLTNRAVASTRRVS